MRQVAPRRVRSLKDAIVATLAASPDQAVRGRALLQGKLYFLAELLGEDFSYRPSYFGSYSSLVADELGALVAAGFVCEMRHTLSPLGPLGERYRHDYQLTPAADEFLSLRATQMAEYSEALARLHRPPVSDDAVMLTLAAKLHLMVADNGASVLAHVHERVRELDWGLTYEDTERVLDYLRLVELVA